MIRTWLMLGFAAGLSACSAGATDNARTLVWAEEFEGETLDRTRWTPETSCWGGGNNERQCYVDTARNIEVSDGLLILRATPDETTGLEFPQDWDARGRTVTKPYSSGKISTKGLANWTYGRMEARMQLPGGQGAWPAFWMMSEQDRYGSWPQSGEIDIMEAVNLGVVSNDGEIETRTSGALHFGNTWPDNQFITDESHLEHRPEADFHTYAVEWRADRIEWFVDNQLFFTATPDDWFTPGGNANNALNAPFDQPFFIMLNLAVGGALPEGRNAKGVDADAFPAELKVDWVRVYE